MPLRSVPSSFASKLFLGFAILGISLFVLVPWSGLTKLALPLRKPSSTPYLTPPEAKEDAFTVASGTISGSRAASASLLLDLTLSSRKAYPATSTPYHLAGTSLSKLVKNPAQTDTTQSLARLALEKVLNSASPIFGQYENLQTDTSTWMSAYPDTTRLVHMNMPGAHDAATWNYSMATQKYLKPITDLVNDTLEFHPEEFRCQDQSLIHMLNAGIRVFDLRYAYDVTKTSLVFWHGPALQSQTATVEDVLISFYHWLDDHPSEVVFLSYQYEPSAEMGNRESESLQKLLFETLTSPAAKKYIVQTQGKLGSLGEARGKIILLRRFDLDKLPAEYEASMPGLHFSPSEWTINGADITIHYNNSTSVVDEESGTAYIEDYYRPDTPEHSTVETNVQAKLDTTLEHLRIAASAKHKDGLFWSFTSCTNILHKPPITPRMLALRNGSNGINHRLIHFFKSMKGQRLGIVMFDFFEEPKELIPIFLSLRAPGENFEDAVP